MSKTKTPEELIAENASLTKENKEQATEINSLNKTIEKLTKEKDSAQTNANQISQVNEGLSEKVNQLVDENTEQADLIIELRDKLSTAKANGNKVVVDHGKKKYTVESGTFKYKGTTYKAEDLLENSALVKELVDKKIGFLVEVE